MDQNIFNYSFYLFFATTLSIKIILLLLNIKNIKLHSQKVPVDFQEHITQDDHVKAQKYTLTKNKFAIFSIFIDALVALIWLKGGALNLLVNWSSSLELSLISQGVLLFSSFLLISSILSIPESLYTTFVIEEKYGFNKTTPKMFVLDMLKQALLFCVILVPFLYAIIYILSALGSMWWLYMWGFIILFQMVILWAYPKFIAPLFNKFTKLDDEELREKINILSKKISLKFQDYYVMDASIRSSHGNAYFTGFGQNKRIVFFDTLLKTLSSNQVIAVLAHELGHMKKKHIMQTLIISSLTMFTGLFILGQVYQSEVLFTTFGVQSNQSYVALLIFLLIVPYYSFLLTPVSAWFSRRNEFEADEFAATNADPKDLIDALLRMYKDNSSTLTPHPSYSKFYYSHPPAKERVDFLKGFITKEVLS